MTAHVYLAASSSDLPRVRRWVRAIEAAGLTLSSRWFDDTGLGCDSALERERQDEIANDCMMALAKSRIVWVLCPRSLVGGSLVELGMAIAFASFDRGRQVVVTGHGSHDTVFTGLRSVFRDPSDDVGFVEVVRLANGVRS